MDKYLIDFEEEDFPKYIQLFKHIKRLIDSGEIEDGVQLPPIRVLSGFLHINTVTVINAYKRLQTEGYAVLKTGSGTFVKKKEQSRNIKKEYSDTFKKVSAGMMKYMIDFSGETTSSTFFPVETFKSVLNEVLDRDGAEALIYQDVLGFRGLRESINRYFWSNDLDVEDILIVSGAQQGIDIISKALINVNDNILMEKPTYSGALTVFSWRRANIYEVDILNDGVDILIFESIVKKNKIKYFYTMSYFQNPTGATYSMEKKLKILELAEKYDFYIIEDDYLSELIYDLRIEYKSFKSIDLKHRVIYIKSFSKIFLPGIRIGYLISPPHFKEVIQSTKINSDISTSSLMQRALDIYINKGYWKDHIAFLKREYEFRYTHLEVNIREILKDKVSYSKPGGGLNFFIKINKEINKTSIALFSDCKDKGVIITPGGIFFKHFEDGNRYFRLGFSQTNIEQIKQGIDIINDLL